LKGFASFHTTSSLLVQGDISILKNSVLVENLFEKRCYRLP
jgi:hypothetical protein